MPLNTCNQQLFACNDMKFLLPIDQREIKMDRVLIGLTDHEKYSR